MYMKNQLSKVYQTLIKKCQPVLLILIIFPKVLFAQIGSSTEERKISFGPKIGMNYSNVFDEQDDDFVASGKFGFVGGGFINFPLGSVISIQPEVLFSQKGFYANGSVVGINYEFKRTTNFLDVPIFAVWSPTPYLNVLVGPQFSYLLKQTDVITYPVNSGNVEAEFENENARKSIASLVAGADFNLLEFVVGLRAGIDFLENQNGNNATTPRYKNSWVQLTIGVRF